MTDHQGLQRLPNSGTRKLASKAFHPLKTLIMGVVNSPDSAGRMAVTTFAVRVGGAALAYISQILLARWMGAHEYGIFSVAWTWIIILGLLACIGFSSSPAKYIPQYKKTGDFSRLRGFLYTSRLAAFLIASIIAVSGIFILFSLRGYIPTHYVLPMAMVLFCLPLFSVGGVQDGIARSYDWPSLSVLPTYIWRPLGILVILFALMTFGEPATAVTAAGAAVAATWGVALYQMVRLNTRIAQTLPPGPRTNELPLWLAVSLPMLMVEGFLQLITSADVIMVSFWHSPEETAVYFAASKTLALIHFVYFAVRSASAHRFAGFVETNDQAGLRSYVQKSSLWTFGPSLLGGVILLALAPFLLSLFGSGFSAGYPVIAILMLGVLARASIGPVDALLMMTGHQRSCAAIYAATFAVNVVLNVIFIPAFGLAGAAAATSLAICFEAVCLATLARHRLSVTTFVPLILLQRRGA